MALYQSLGRLVTLMFGDAYYAPLNDNLGTVSGYPVTPISKISLGSPAAADTNYIVESVAISDGSTTALTLAHSTLDVPRNIQAVAAATSSSDAILNIVGICFSFALIFFIIFHAAHTQRHENIVIVGR